MNMILPQGFLKGAHFSSLKRTERWVILYAMFESDELGIACIDRELFPFQTGVPLEVLDSAIEKLGDKVFIEGEHHWFCELIHEQYGRLPEKIRWNSMFGTLIKKMVKNSYPPSIMPEIIARYPFFEDHYLRYRDEGILPSVKKPEPPKPEKKSKKDSPNF